MEFIGFYKLIVGRAGAKLALGVVSGLSLSPVSAFCVLAVKISFSMKLALQPLTAPRLIPKL